MGKIFVLIGPSCSGKDTLFTALKEDYPELEPIVLYTNRPIREKEIDGVTYNFVSLDKIKEMEENNEIIEIRTYETAYGPWVYATSSKSIDLNNKNYLSINTLEGYKSLKEYYKDDVIPLLIKVDDDIRLKRAIKREKKQKEPKYEEMYRRFEADKIDFSDENLNACGINEYYVNNDLNICLSDLEFKIDTELSNNKRR